MNEQTTTILIDTALASGSASADRSRSAVRRWRTGMRRSNKPLDPWSPLVTDELMTIPW